MLFKEIVEQAFGKDGDKQVLEFLIEKELSQYKEKKSRWKNFVEKCEAWKKDFLLWEDETYVDGLKGYNLNIHIIKVRLPQKNVSWTEYLYHMALLAYYRMETASTITSSAVLANTPYDLFITAMHLKLLSSYAALSQEQLFNELENLYQNSWHTYQSEKELPLEYREEMEKNYPKFCAMLEYLKQNIEACEAVRMNDLIQNDIVWYFVKDTYAFYMLLLSE